MPEAQASQDFRVHFTFLGKTTPLYTLLSLLVLCSLGLWRPHLFGLGLKILTIVMTFCCIWIWKKYLTILRGAPAFVVGAEGIWIELDQYTLRWNKISSIRKYENPEFLVIDFPLENKPFIGKFLPSTFIKQQQRCFFTSKHIRELMAELCKKLQSHYNIEYLPQAPKDLIEELKRQI